MTNPLPRIYVIAGSVLVLFLAWAVIAAHPWVPAAGAKADPRMQALAAREQRLRHDALVIKRIVNKRWHTYTVALRLRKHEIALAERRHRVELAAAQKAAASAAQLAATTPSYSASPSYSSSSSSAAPVRVVTLPPITVTRTS